MKKGALIVETRNYPDLAEVIQGHLKYLPIDWGLMIVTTEDNKLFLQEIFPEASFHLVESNFEEEAYNRLITSPEFISKIPFEKFLVFQHDSRLLNYWDVNFEKYDYIGAPWTFQDHGGNGGLSWRSKKMMLQISERVPFFEIVHGNEDVYYCNNMQSFGFNLAPREVCSRFSCESIFQSGTFGYHAIEKWLSPEEISQVKDQRVISDLEKAYERKCFEISDINEHLPILKVLSSKCSHVTEMGVRGIVSTYAFLSGLPKKMISYDINHCEGIEEVERLASEESIDFEFRISDVLKIEIEPTDLLFIDTLHTYTQLSQELRLHSGKVKKYIVLHDTTTYAFNPEPSDWQTQNIMENYVFGDKGLWPAVEEFLNENPEWMLLDKRDNNNGLTVLKKI